MQNKCYCVQIQISTEDNSPVVRVANGPAGQALTCRGPHYSTAVMPETRPPTHTAARPPIPPPARPPSLSWSLSFPSGCLVAFHSSSLTCPSSWLSLTGPLSFPPSFLPCPSTSLPHTHSTSSHPSSSYSLLLFLIPSRLTVSLHTTHLLFPPTVPPTLNQCISPSFPLLFSHLLCSFTLCTSLTLIVSLIPSLSLPASLSTSLVADSLIVEEQGSD